MNLLRSACATFSLVAITGAANAQSIPVYDVNTICGSLVDVAQVRYCVVQEQSTYDEVSTYWDRLPADDKARCVQVHGVEPFGLHHPYTLLRNCLNRDIVHLRFQDERAVPVFRR